MSEVKHSPQTTAANRDAFSAKLEVPIGLKMFRIAVFWTVEKIC